MRGDRRSVTRRLVRSKKKIIKVSNNDGINFKIKINIYKVGACRTIIVARRHGGSVNS